MKVGSRLLKYTFAKFFEKLPEKETNDKDSTVLPLATLGGRTHMEIILFVSHRLRWPRQVQYLLLRIIYIGDVILPKTSATATDIDNKATEYVLALATFGDTTRNRNNPICVLQTKVANASTMVSVACHCRRRYHNKLRQCKQGFMCCCRGQFSLKMLCQCTNHLINW